MVKGYLRLAANSWRLGTEASLVLPLRLVRIARGGMPAAREACRMVSEKAEALVTLRHALHSGAPDRNPVRVADTTVTHFLKYVRANRKRLMGTEKPR